MAVLLDANVLILLFDEQAAAPGDPDTGQPVTHCQARLRHFFDVYSRPKGAKTVIPTPALSESWSRSSRASDRPTWISSGASGAVVSRPSATGPRSSWPKCRTC